MRRFLLLLVLLTAVPVVLLLVPSRPSAPEGFAVEQFRACPPPREVEVEVLAFCIEQVLLNADAVGQFPAAYAEMSRTVTADPAWHDACHFASHRVGKVLVRDGGSALKLLGDYPQVLCSWGLGHGVMEGFARLDASPAEWSALAAVCRDLSSPGSAVQGAGALCADGFGHAVWDATGGFRPAVGSCGLLGEVSLVSSCVAGVMMQRFRPADRVKGSPPSSGLAPTEVLAVCTVPVFGFPEGFSSGCVAGAGYVLSQDLLADRLVGSDGARVLEDLSAGVLEAERACLSSGLGAECLGSVLGNLGSDLRALPGEQVCARVLELRVSCLGSFER